MRLSLFYIFLILFGSDLLSQEATLQQFFRKSYDYYNYPLEIVSQTDTTVTVLSETKSGAGRDLVVTKYTIYDTTELFSKKLMFDALFDARFNSKEINFHFFENNGFLSVVVEKKVKDKIVVYGKTISSDGKASGFIPLDSIEKTDNNLESFKYMYSHASNRKNIIMVCRKTYLSGFIRDKCILLNTVNLEKNLEIDLPKNSLNISQNYNFETDFQNNLFYGVFNNNTAIGDSLIIFKVDTKTKVLDQFKIVKQHFLTNFKPLFSNQILIYGIINLTYEDKTFCEKSMHYQRINLNTKQVISNMVIPLSPTNQSNLTYTYKSLDKDPLSKIFTLVSDDIIDGRLITVYEHNHYSTPLSELNRRITVMNPNIRNSTITEKLEYLASSYNLSTDQLEYVSLIPKKVIYNTNRYDMTEINPFSCVYFNNNINLSFYENRANLTTRPNQSYKIIALSQVSTLTDVNTVSYKKDDKKLISFNLQGYWRPLHVGHTLKCNKIYYFNYAKDYMGIAYYKLEN